MRHQSILPPSFICEWYSYLECSQRIIRNSFDLISTYRGRPFSVISIVKKDPGRTRQSTLATAGTNFTKPLASNKVYLLYHAGLSERPRPFISLLCLTWWSLSLLTKRGQDAGNCTDPLPPCHFPFQIGAGSEDKDGGCDGRGKIMGGSFDLVIHPSGEGARCLLREEGLLW